VLVMLEFGLGWSLLGIGFPPWTGGVIQYVSSYQDGPKGFAARASELDLGLILNK
jgi:hypothetical protein